MDPQEPIVAPGDLHEKYQWLCSVIEDSLPGVGRESIPGVGGDFDLIDCADLRDHPVYGAAIRDEKLQATLRLLAQEVLESQIDVTRTGFQARLAFVRSLVIPRDGNLGLSPILTQQLLMVIAEDMESSGLSDDAQCLRGQVNRLDELVREHTELGCVPGSDQLLTLRAAFGEESLPEQRGWRMEDLLKQYLRSHHALVKQREHSPEPDQRARTSAMKLFGSDAIRLCGDASPRLPVEDAVELTKLIIELRLFKSHRERGRLVAMVRHGSYRAASREVRENPGSFYKAICRLFRRVRKRLDAWEMLGLAAAAADDDAERRAVTLMNSRDVEMKKPTEIAREFGMPDARAASSALSRARKRVQELARLASQSGLSPEDLPFPRD